MADDLIWAGDPFWVWEHLENSMDAPDAFPRASSIWLFLSHILL